MIFLAKPRERERSRPQGNRWKLTWLHSLRSPAQGTLSLHGVPASTDAGVEWSEAEDAYSPVVSRAGTTQAFLATLSTGLGSAYTRTLTRTRD